MSAKIDLKAELEKAKNRQIRIRQELIEIQAEMNAIQQKANKLNVETIQLDGLIKGLELGIQNG